MGFGQARLGVGGQPDLVAPHLHLQAQRIARGGVFLDDQHAVALAEGVRRRAVSGPTGLDARQRQHHPRALAGAIAVSVDPAVVQLHDAACQGQADAEPARLVTDRLLLAREQLERVRQEVGRHALAAIGDADLDPVLECLHAQRDDAGFVGELGCVHDDVRERLDQPRLVALGPDARAVRQAHVERMPELDDRGGARVDGTAHDAVDRDRLADQRDLSLRGTGRVDQVLDHPLETVDLALEDLAQACEDRMRALERAQHARGVGDRRERVAQLVRQH